MYFLMSLMRIQEDAYKKYDAIVAELFNQILLSFYSEYPKI